MGLLSSYDGTLKLTAPDLQPGFEDLPDERRELPVDPDVPVLQLTDADVYQYAGPAGKVLPAVKAGAVVTARSEFDPSKIEVIQVGASKRTMERYIGQSRASVRGEFVSFKNGVLRIRGKAISPLAPNEYERVMAARVDKTTSIVESTDGGEYKPSTIETLAALKEGATVTIRKAEEVVIEIQVGLPRR